MSKSENIAPSQVAPGQLKSIVERVERLEDDKREVAEDIKEVYAEAKANGFDAKAIRKVVSLRRKTPDERAEEEAVLDLYLSALGMLNDTPLGRHAVAEAAAEGLGESVPLTDKEKAAGVLAAFERPGGQRMTIMPGPGPAKAA